MADAPTGSPQMKSPPMKSPPMKSPPMKSPPMKSPLARAIGLGSAKEGVDHWWWQRISSIALVPLSLWFVVSVIGLAGADFDTLVNWLYNPIAAVLFVLLLAATFYH